MKRRGIVSVVFAAIGLYACGQASGVAAQQTGEVQPQPSIVLPAELDRVLRDYERYWQAGDEDALAALFVEEGLIIRDGMWIRGRASIRTAYRSASGPLRLRAIEFAADGELGYIVGAYGYGDQAPAEDVGMFVLTLRHDSAHGWLIVSDMDRSASG